MSLFVCLNICKSFFKSRVGVETIFENSLIKSNYITMIKICYVYENCKEMEGFIKEKGFKGN